MTLDTLYPPLQKKIDDVMKDYPVSLWMSLNFKDKDHSEKAWKERINIPLKFLLGYKQNRKLNSLQTFPFGSIKPTGWLKTQMQKDMKDL